MHKAWQFHYLSIDRVQMYPTKAEKAASVAIKAAFRQSTKKVKAQMIW
jgi:hypothetical protein